MEQTEEDIESIANSLEEIPRIQNNPKYPTYSYSGNSVNSEGDCLKSSCNKQGCKMDMKRGAVVGIALIVGLILGQELKIKF